MMCPAFNFFKVVIELGLFSCVFICMDLFECLVFFEHINIQSEFINKGCSSMLDDVVGSDQDVESLMRFFNVVVEDSESLDEDVEDLVEGLQFVGHRR